MTTQFHHSASPNPPSVMRVLNALLDNVNALQGGYEDWCNERVFDPLDADKQKRYQQVIEQEQALMELLGEDYQLFLYGDESDE